MLCGSSARTPTHDRANLPAGPGTPNGIRLCDPKYPISTSCTRSAAGFCPRHSDSLDPWRVLAGCVADYQTEEVFDEGPTCNTAAFPRFYDALAFRRGDLVNYSNMAGKRLPCKALVADNGLASGARSRHRQPRLGNPNRRAGICLLRTIGSIQGLPNCLRKHIQIILRKQIMNLRHLMSSTFKVHLKYYCRKKPLSVRNTAQNSSN